MPAVPMIDRGDYDKIANRAFTEAERFLAFLKERNLSARDFLGRDTGNVPLANQKRLVLLGMYLMEKHDCMIIAFDTFSERWPNQGFASWLYRAVGKMYITINGDQIEKWVTDFGSPTDVQMVRSGFHELGHLLFSASLKEPSSDADDNTDPMYTNAATAREEEKAWVFAFTFFAILIGEYAWLTRQSPYFRDDAPGVLV